MTSRVDLRRASLEPQQHGEAWALKGSETKTLLGTHRVTCPRLASGLGHHGHQASDQHAWAGRAAGGPQGAVGSDPLSGPGESGQPEWRGCDRRAERVAPRVAAELEGLPPPWSPGGLQTAVLSPQPLPFTQAAVPTWGTRGARPGALGSLPRQQPPLKINDMACWALPPCYHAHPSVPLRPLAWVPNSTCLPCR